MPLMIIITMTMMMLRVVVVRAIPAIDGVTHEGLVRASVAKSACPRTTNACATTALSRRCACSETPF